MTGRVVVLTKWDPRLLATRDITPALAQAAVLTWEEFPDVDGGVPDRLALPLALALTSMGEVLFRLGGAVPPGTRLIGALRTGVFPCAPAWKVIGSRDPETVLALFGTGWAEGDQTAVIGAASDVRAMEVLGSKRPSDLSLGEDELTCSAIVDGAVMLIAASRSAPLERAIEAVERQCRDAGIAVSR